MQIKLVVVVVVVGVESVDCILQSGSPQRSPFQLLILLVTNACKTVCNLSLAKNLLIRLILCNQKKSCTTRLGDMSRHTKNRVEPGAFNPHQKCWEGFLFFSTPPPYSMLWYTKRRQSHHVVESFNLLRFVMTTWLKLILQH